MTTIDYTKIPRVEGLIVDPSASYRQSEPIERPDPTLFYVVRWDDDALFDFRLGYRPTRTGEATQRDSLVAYANGEFEVSLAPYHSDEPDAVGHVVACGTPEEVLREAMWAAEAALAELDKAAPAQSDRLCNVMQQAVRYAGPALSDADCQVVEQAHSAMRDGDGQGVLRVAERAAETSRTLLREAQAASGNCASQKRAVAAFYESVGACCAEWLSTHN